MIPHPCVRRGWRASLFGLLLCNLLPAGQAADWPRKTSLDGTWQFHFAADQPAADEYRWFFAPDFDTSNFDRIEVPSHWALLGYEDPTWVNGSQAEGFYVRTFTVPDDVEDLRSVLRFGGVWQSAEVWLNGVALGRHDSGFTQFGFETTEVLKPGENRLAVRVRQQPPAFKFDANDDWALAGIYRSVWLDFTPKDLYLASVEVETDFDDQYRDADLKLRVFVDRAEEGHWLDPGPPFDIRAILRDGAGNEVGQATATVSVAGAHNGRDVPLTLHVTSPKPWTAETPNLYDLTVELVRDGKVTHSWQDHVGFREVTIDDGVLRINGQPVKLRGVARHDQHPDVGRATRREHWLEDIELMKAANINSVRTAHYPPAEGFLRLCDELGLYVLDEVPLGFGGERMRDPSYTVGLFLRIQETVARDRNRPSVIIWDLGNEDPLTALHLAGLRALKGLDPTRPVLMPFRVEEGLPPELDIRAPHYWLADDYDRLAADSDRPIVTTEYTHAIGPSDFGELQERWDALTNHPAGAGGMIWLWADQGLRRSTKGRDVLDPMRDKAKYTREGGELVRHSDAGRNEIFDAHGNYGTDGIVDPDRTPQRDYWETKAVYAPARVLIDEVSFSPGQQSVSIPIRNEFDFLNLSKLVFQWRLFRDAEGLASGEATLDAKPHETAELVVPTDAIAADAAGTHYVQITVRRPDGSVMAERSVQLGELPKRKEFGERHTVQLRSDGNNVAISAGPAVYEFDSTTGELASLEVSNRILAKGSDIVIWRPGTYAERNRLDKNPVQHDWETFMQGLKPTLKSWKTDESDSGVTLSATVEYREDEKNLVEVDYQYHVGNNGVLTIEYLVRPTLDVEWIPEVGIELDLVDQPLNVTWLGLGPLDSLPNKKAAARFGQWSAPVYSNEASGTKSGVEWLKVTAAEGRGIYVDGAAGFRFVHDANGGSKLRVLSHLAGAWTKNGPAERPEWRLDLSEDSEFKGSIRIAHLPVDERSNEHAAEGPAHPAVVKAKFVYDEAPYPQCHASTIAETSPGKLVAAWFGGTHERHPDVGIWVAYCEDGQWQEAVEVANGLQDDGTRYPTWNPVLFQAPEGPLYLYYKVGPDPRQWWGMVTESSDGGHTWSEPKRLPDGYLGPIKNKPVVLEDGSWLAPSSTESLTEGWKVHFERTPDRGGSLERIGPVDKGKGYDAIQPSILFHQDGRLQALCRSKQGVIASTWSADQGLTWSPLEATTLPNPSSGIDAVTLADGRHVVIYNHTAGPPERPQKGVRYTLDLAVSSDGIHWDRVLNLENEPLPNGYAYPAVIQTADGLLHITYTWDRRRVKHLVIDPTKL